MQSSEAAAAFAALSQDARLNLMRLLIAEGPTGLPAGELASRLGLPASTTSFHLAALERAGLTQATRLHRQLEYCLRPCAGDRTFGHSPQPGQSVARSARGTVLGRCATAIPLVLALVVGSAHVARLVLVVTIGLGILGFAFAVISSLHSYLILGYAGSEKAAEDVGFYYAANAGGRLIGILLSGALAQAGGLSACLWGSTVMLALGLAIEGAARRRIGRLDDLRLGENFSTPLAAHSKLVVWMRALPMIRQHFNDTAV